MRSPDFGNCFARSMHLAKEFGKYDYDTKVLYGIYIPTTPKKSWDERWQKVQGDEFLHFWLELFDREYKMDMWLDYSLFQFGARSYVWSDIGDSHYKILGECSATGALTPTSNEIVLWDTLTNEEAPSVQIGQAFI